MYSVKKIFREKGPIEHESMATRIHSINFWTDQNFRFSVSLNPYLQFHILQFHILQFHTLQFHILQFHILYHVLLRQKKVELIADGAACLPSGLSQNLQADFAEDSCSAKKMIKMDKPCIVGGKPTECKEFLWTESHAIYNIHVWSHFV